MVRCEESVVAPGWGQSRLSEDGDLHVADLADAEAAFMGVAIQLPSGRKEAQGGGAFTDAPRHQ